MTFSIFLLLTMVAAIGVARLLRGLGLPGARILGGLVVGVVLGPVVFGRIAPNDWIRIVMGGQMERARIHELERDHAAWRFAAATVPLPPEEIAAESDRHRTDLEPLEARPHAAAPAARRAATQGASRLSTASINAVVPSARVAFTAAPAAMRAATLSSAPFLAAHVNAVVPHLSDAFTQAPAAMSAATVAPWPKKAALNNGVPARMG